MDNVKKFKDFFLIKIWFILLIWVSIMFSIMFYNNIIYKQKINNIYEQYEKDMNKLHKTSSLN